MTTAAQLFVKCLENEGVEYIFGIPGEENIDIMDALLDSSIRFVTTHHEQGAAFMADVYGRLTGRAGVCMSTLGPGATNLITGVADANMDRAPIVAIAGQGATTRLHKESHQILDLVNLFTPITKYSTQIREAEIVPEIVRKAFKVAQTEKPGGAFIDFPENIAALKFSGRPIEALTAEDDAHYIVAMGARGDITSTLRRIALKAKPQKSAPFKAVRKAIFDDRSGYASDDGFPVKPQKNVWDLREVLSPEDIAISDVGAHKMWMARMYRAERPNTCIISNGFAAMGIAVPGAIAAKLAYPERKVVAVTGDAGFMMNSQEIETALRMKTPFVVLIWNDAEYGLITWHQLRHFGRPSNVSFKNPDFVKYAESFGAKGYRVERTQDLVPTLEKALADDTVVIIDCPVDYSENMKLTQRLKELVSPV